MDNQFLKSAFNFVRVLKDAIQEIALSKKNRIFFLSKDYPEYCLKKGRTCNQFDMYQFSDEYKQKNHVSKNWGNHLEPSKKDHVWCLFHGDANLHAELHEPFNPNRSSLKPSLLVQIHKDHLYNSETDLSKKN